METGCLLSVMRRKLRKLQISTDKPLRWHKDMENGKEQGGQVTSIE